MKLPTQWPWPWPARDIVEKKALEHRLTDLYKLTSPEMSPASDPFDSERDYWDFIPMVERGISLFESPVHFDSYLLTGSFPFQFQYSNMKAHASILSDLGALAMDSPPATL